MMPRKYPWEEWFAEERVILKRGVHYHCSQSTMAQIIRNNASARRVGVRIVDTGDGMLIEVTGGEGKEEAVPAVRGDVPSEGTAPPPARI